MTRPCVLVMDPDVEGSEMLALAADRLGVTTRAVHDLDDLVSALLRGIGDVLVIDVDRLGPANVPLLRWLRNVRPGLLIVPTSAAGVLALEAHVRQQGVFYFLTKPAERGELLLVLHDARQALAPAMAGIRKLRPPADLAGLAVEGADERERHD